MMKLSSRRHFAASASALAVALSCVASPAMAQDATDEAAAAAEDEGDVIVVSGYAQSLANAAAVKKRAEQVVESVSAEDIGKLPDASIGEAISRLPGLTSQRQNGRSAYISLRGFGPDLTLTTLNGREQTSTGDNRAVEFDQYPSEMVSRVDVFKTPSASMIAQGLAGTIDIRTARPLETSRQVLAVGVRGSMTSLGALNAGSGDKGFRVHATYIDQFSDTFGLALTANYVDENYQVQEYGAWGYNDYTLGANTGRLIAGNKSFVTSTNLKRLGLGGTIQADLTDDTRLTVDVLYTKFDDDIIKRGIELPLSSAFGWTGAAISSPTFENGHVVSGRFTGIEGVVNNHKLQRTADLLSTGMNLSHKFSDATTLTLDWGRSATDRSELVFESNAGTGRGQGVGAVDTISFTQTTTGGRFTPTLNYSDPALIQLTSPMGWGGISGGQDGYYNNRIVNDRLNTYRADIEHELGSFLKSVKVGVALTDREKSLTPDEYFVTLASGASMTRVPDQFLLRPTQLRYLGLGPMISYDPQALLDAGIYRLVPNAVQDVFSKSYKVAEQLLTGYVQGNFEAELGANSLTGNVGVQIVKTDQSSDGFIFFNGARSTLSLGAKYTDVLPSLNMSLRMPSDFVVRLGLAREIQRQRLDDMRVSIGYGVDRSGTTPIIRGGGGNPFLRPTRANAIDLTFEKYFSGKGFIAAQLFYKKLLNWTYRDEVAFDYTGFPLGAEVVPSMIGTISRPVNGKGGKIYGAELAGTLPFDAFIPALEGFGINGALGYTKTKVSTSSTATTKTEILGFSKWTGSLTAYFERSGFSARVSARYRSSFLGELAGFGGNRTYRRALPETIIDAQIGYDFPETSSLSGLSIYLQGQNLTNEAFGTIAANDRPLEVLDYQRYGRRYQAGATFKF